MSPLVMVPGKEGMRYRWPKDGDPEFIAPRVSEILDNFSKPWLKGWYAKLAATWAVENIPTWESLHPDAAVAFIRTRASDAANEARNRGSAVHEAIANQLLGDEETDDLEMLPYVSAAFQYMNDHVRKVLHVETTLYNRTYEYAGTCDLMAVLKNGNTAIIDWKTGSINPEAALQLNAYANAEFIGKDDREIDFPPIDEAHVVHLPGDATYKAYPVQLTDRAFRTFVALRSLQKWKDDFEGDAFGEVLEVEE